jgi:hypothetical protein
MNRIRRSSFARSFLLPFALTLWLSACHKWVDAGPPELALQEQADKPVQDRDRLQLHTEPDTATFEGDPILIGPDSIVLAKGDERVEIPTKEVVRVDVRKSNLLTTGGLVAIGVVIGLLITFAGDRLES